MCTIELWAFSTSKANKSPDPLFQNELVFLVVRTPLNAVVHSLLRRGGGGGGKRGGGERGKKREKKRERGRKRLRVVRKFDTKISDKCVVCACV